MIMSSWHTLFFFFLTSAIYLQSMNAAAAPTAQFYLPGRRPLRDLRILHSRQQDADHKIQVLPKETTIVAIQPDSFSEESASVDYERELVYHIDYHGVTTHPNPTPKHPKP